MKYPPSIGGEIERPARTASIYQRLRRKTDTFEPLFRRKALKTSVKREVQIPAHRITIPPRPYLGLSDDDREQIVVMARAWLLAP